MATLLGYIFEIREAIHPNRWHTNRLTFDKPDSNHQYHQRYVLYKDGQDMDNQILT